MKLAYGSYVHAANEVTLAISRSEITSPVGRSIGHRERWTITGELFGNSSAELTTAINALVTAYSVNGNNLILFEDDLSTWTAHAMISSLATGGVRITTKPEFPVGDGTEYATVRSYSIVAEADFYNGNFPLLEFSETVEVTGGGPRVIWIETRTGPPVQQMVSQQTTSRATQSGRAVGLGNYPNPADPIWPGLEDSTQRRITRETPRFSGDNKVEYPVSWSYVFESSGPLFGTPTLS